MELPKKQCLYCQRNIRRSLSSVAYEISICSKCLKTNPDCEEIRRARNAQYQKEYYDRNVELMREKAKKKRAKKSAKA